MDGDPVPVALQDDHPFHLISGEIPLLTFTSVLYLKETVSTFYEGGDYHISIGHLKGFYSHFGALKDHRVENDSLKEIDGGAMLLTTQNFHFCGDNANVRIPFERVIGFRPRTDGIGLFREGACAKGEVFRLREVGIESLPVDAHQVIGWLLFNMATFLAQPEGRALYAATTQDTSIVRRAYPAMRARRHGEPIKRKGNTYEEKARSIAIRAAADGSYG
jgi:hypothetical protein